MVPADSHKASPTTWYSGYCYRQYILHLRDYHLLWYFFPKASVCILFHIAVLQPFDGHNHRSLGYSLFARHYLGNHNCFLFLQVLRCFSSLGFLSAKQNFTPSAWRVFLFGDLRIASYSALPRSLSQLITSFIVFESQGILHALLVTFFLLLSEFCVWVFKIFIAISFNMSKNFSLKKIFKDCERISVMSRYLSYRLTANGVLYQLELIHHND